MFDPAIDKGIAAAGALRSDFLALRCFKSIIADSVTPQALADADFKDELLIGVLAVEQFKWMSSYYASYGGWPTELAFGAKYEELPELSEPFAYLASELHIRRSSFLLSKGLRDAAVQIEAKRPDEAIRTLGTVLTTCGAKAKGVASFKKGVEDRIALYTMIKAGGGPITLPTLWPTLDKETQGLVDGSLNVVVAPANTGKSWMTCLLANHYLKLGHKVLLITLEMSSRRILTRLDSLKYRLPFGGLRDCTLPTTAEVAWAEEAKKDTTGLVGDIIVADKMTVRTVFDAFQLVQAHTPRVVLIDGGYRFEGANSKVSAWESSKQIVGDLQLYSETSNVPWVVTTQYELDAPGGKGVKVGEHPMRMAGVKYAKEWVINPDVVVGMYQSEFDRASLKMLLVLLKSRDHSGESGLSSVAINWDLTNSIFTELPLVIAPLSVEHDPSALPTSFDSLFEGL